MAPLLQFSQVSYRVGELTILEGIDWCVEPGQHWAVLGPNGSGKTTLLRIACGYLWPNAGGEVRRVGKAHLDLRHLRRSIGWVSSKINARIGPQETALETVLSGMRAQIGWRPIVGEQVSRQDVERAEHYLEQMGQIDLQKKHFAVLSQGEQQSVLLARARMAQPLIIVLDEPCAGLDPGMREQFLDTLAEVVAAPEAPTLILVTHHLEEIVPGIEHTLVINAGRVEAIGKTSEVINEQLIAKLYTVDPPELICRGGRYWTIWPSASD
jgi:iron complex transport system ATP-binding protein